ncbi:hypothetical protein G20c_67 [Thermus phage G20c]|nr:hypothetical protein G20c_67 [Thermus phage G20c]
MNKLGEFQQKAASKFLALYGNVRLKVERDALVFISEDEGIYRELVCYSEDRFYFYSRTPYTIHMSYYDGERLWNGRDMVFPNPPWLVEIFSGPSEEEESE